ncbi:uncharacterized protein BO97DRAFT_436301 [Aspergillus homomorphus CBS 101889]|uniref:DUF7702 domain-containing protein n=1 Tax=Aspergillus homomorphus (strain CBS 101889) TaxID=1450537 RepID=A0A395HR67_ASPHC|nr:hypothetical protein BO97DRAFT_436301 [Aspergillus homomorphus CBS 101889]RAL10250.1 hypothetical protein BO97DRAFT_436301 [Aspergillus homomorphus CBS 101889]
MFNDHSKASIAQIIFYIPVIFISAYHAYYRHKRPRMSWLIILFFSLIRVAAGSLVILFEHKPQTGIMVASIILLNTGVFPLIAATLGFIRIILAHEKEVINPRINRCLMFSRMLFFVGLGLQIAGGCLEGSDSASDIATGVKLVKAGYSIVVVFEACLLLVQAYFWMHLPDLSHISYTILKAMALALPFLIVRITYLFLSVFHASDLRWNDLAGPITPFVLMGLLMEYAVVWIYLGTGFIIPSWKDMKGDRVVSITRSPLVEQV